MYQEAIAYAIVNFNRNFWQWVKTIVNSFLVLGVAISCLQIMKYFSHKHKLHFFVDVGIRSHLFHLPPFNWCHNQFSSLLRSMYICWLQLHVYIVHFWWSLLRSMLYIYIYIYIYFWVQLHVYISFIFERASVVPTRDFSTFLRF